MSFHIPDSILYKRTFEEYAEYKPHSYVFHMQLADRYFKDCQDVLTYICDGYITEFYQYIKRHKEHYSVEIYLHNYGDETYHVIETTSKDNSKVKIYINNDIVKLDIETVFHHIIVNQNTIE